MELKNFHNWTLLSCITFILGSCAPAYVPNTVNTPMFSNKGDIQVNLNAGISGFDPQLSYAVTDKLGIMLNGSFANSTSDSSVNFHKHQFIEIGTGYYTKIGTSGRFETFGGLGYGKVKAEYDNDLWQSHADVDNIRIFIQPSIGVASDVFDGSLSSRFVFINLYKDSNESYGLFAEPALTGKLGYKYVKAVLQLGLSIPLNADNIDFNYQPLLFSVGLQANIDEFFK